MVNKLHWLVPLISSFKISKEFICAQVTMILLWAIGSERAWGYQCYEHLFQLKVFKIFYTNSNVEKLKLAQNEIIYKIHDLMEDWRCLRLVVLCTFQLIENIIFWTTFDDDEAIHSMDVLIVHSWSKTVCSCFSRIHRTSVIVSSLWTKHWNTFTSLTPNNGLPAESLHQERKTPFFQSLNLWWRFLELSRNYLRRIFGKG